MEPLQGKRELFWFKIRYYILRYKTLFQSIIILAFMTNKILFLVICTENKPNADYAK